MILLIETLERLENKKISEILYEKLNKYEDFYIIEEYIKINKIFHFSNYKEKIILNSKFLFYNNKIAVHTNFNDLKSNLIINYIENIITKKQKLYVLTTNKQWILLNIKNKNLHDEIATLLNNNEIILRIMRKN